MLLVLALVSPALFDDPARLAVFQAEAQATANAPEAGLVSIVLEGIVLGPDGEPAEGAVVISGAGGQVVTDVAGNYRLDVEVPEDATSVRVTAVGRAGANLAATTSVALATATGTVRTFPLGPLQLASGTTCSPSWLPTFGELPGVGLVAAMAVFDDGSGPALYAGGALSPPGLPATRVARWDGAGWAPLGNAAVGQCYALAVFDDGTGAALFASFEAEVRKWNGSSWSSVGSAMSSRVRALAVFDDGTGEALYAGGDFSTAGGVPASHIARWDGTSWAAVGTGMDGTVFALEVYDDGSGPALFAGGTFTIADGVPASNIARWNGSSWSALGSGTSAGVASLTVYDSGSGAALHVGGAFTSAGGTLAKCIARWNGSTWSALGSGTDSTVLCLRVYDTGSGPQLYAGGYFSTAGGAAASRIARWDGTSWSALGSGAGYDLGNQNPYVGALGVFDDGSGSQLYVGGSFSYLGEVSALGLGRWDGGWSPMSQGFNSSVSAVTVFDDGSGPALYVGGSFTGAGGVRANRIVKWDGITWSALGSGLTGINDSVRSLAVFDDGGGPELYVCGDFTSVGGVPANRIARWDGASWSALGTGLDYIALAMTTFDDGSGEKLYVGGGFTTAGGVPVNHVARWNGTSWSALFTGMNLGGAVKALAVYDDGSGPALFAAGLFTTAGLISASRIAKWDGAFWSALGSGLGSSGFPSVEALEVFDDGGGPELYAAGDFTTAGGLPANHIARWDGVGWSALGSGLGTTSQGVSALTAFDDGTGPALFAGGYFTQAGGIAANRLARWNGTSWSPLGGGVDNSVVCLAHAQGGPAPGLLVGGPFMTSHAGDSFLARWGCLDTTAPVLSCPVSFAVMDRFPNGLGEPVIFTVTATDDLDPAPTLVCVPASGSVFPPGTTVVHCTATDASGNQASCEFPVTVLSKARRR